MATIRSARTFAGVEERGHEKCVCSISDRNHVADIASGGGPRPFWCGSGCQFDHRRSDSKRSGMQYGMWPGAVPGHSPRDLRVRLSPDVLRQRIQFSAGLLFRTCVLCDTAITRLLPLIACEKNQRGSTSAFVDRMLWNTFARLIFKWSQCRSVDHTQPTPEWHSRSPDPSGT
jgi:hypothetical protein